MRHGPITPTHNPKDKGVADQYQSCGQRPARGSTDILILMRFFKVDEVVHSKWPVFDESRQVVEQFHLKAPPQLLFRMVTPWVMGLWGYTWPNPNPHSLNFSAVEKTSKRTFLSRPCGSLGLTSQLVGDGASTTFQMGKGKEKVVFTLVHTYDPNCSSIDRYTAQPQVLPTSESWPKKKAVSSPIFPRIHPESEIGTQEDAQVKSFVSM